MIWDSAFDWGSGEAGSSGDPLSFVETVSPAAVSLLFAEPDPSSGSVECSSGFAMEMRVDCFRSSDSGQVRSC